MRCPWCPVDSLPRELHRHLGEAHGAEVRTSERDGKQFYEITCPLCGASYDQRVKKGSRDPEFLAEFEREIRLVAFDMLVHHLIAEHEPQETGG